MSLIKTAGVAIALIGAVHAQTSVVTVFFPDVDGALVGSVIASDTAQTTLVVACPSSVSSEDCGLPSPVTVTAGPSTFHAELAEELDSVTAVIDCVLDGTSAATCAQTFVGPAYFLDDSTETSTSNTAITTSATTTVLSGTDITFMPITLVDSIDTGAAATTGATGSGSTASSTGSGTTSGSSTATSSGSSTASQTGSSTASGASTSATGNGAGRTDSRALAYSVVGAGLLGLTAFIL